MPQSTADDLDDLSDRRSRRQAFKGPVCQGHRAYEIGTKVLIGEGDEFRDKYS